MTKDIRARIERVSVLTAGCGCVSYCWRVTFSHYIGAFVYSDWHSALHYANDCVGQARRARDMFND